MSKLKVRVNRSGPESMTRQITNQLAGLINTGILAAGEMLPSERTLADSLGVARNVVRRSYDYLASSDLIAGEGRRGRRVRGSSSGASPRKKSGAATAARASGRKTSAKKGAAGKGSKKAGRKSSKAGGRKSR